MHMILVKEVPSGTFFNLQKCRFECRFILKQCRNWRSKTRDAMQEEMNFYRDWSGKGNSLIISYFQDQMERISSGKKHSCTREMAEALFRLLSYLLNNKEELLERELSMIVLADSKAFEMKYRK